jgi:glycogen phosphorylase
MPVMRKIHQFGVYPHLPARLSGLEELAYNLRWTWDSRTFRLFRYLDPDMLEKCGGNPVLQLRRVSRERLEQAALDPAFLTQLDGALEDLRRYMAEPGWFQANHPEHADTCVAYFCMEYGLTSCLPIYSGGLGVLAGDHLKSASGLGIPLVAVGLLYNRGYFVQYLDDNGWQREKYRVQDLSTLPIRPVMAGETLQAARGWGEEPAPPETVRAPGAGIHGVGVDPGAVLKVSLDIAGRTVWAQVWRAQVGRIALYLLDTALSENDPAAQRISNELYGGGPEERLAQELVLGIGGTRALRALGVNPHICHLNEGHAVFASLERMRHLMETEGLTFMEARQATSSGTLFTTHTPVSAGFDLFPESLISHDLGPTLKELGLTAEQFMRMGRIHRDDHHEDFNVAVLALRQSPRRNAVSRLHRRVTARMMQPGWPEFPLNEMPVDSVTNGVHTKTWVAADMEQLFDHYLGTRWRFDASDKEAWRGVDEIPDLELWRTHTRLRERLVGYVREEAQAHSPETRLTNGLAGPQTGSPLRPDALTIGFARRFATYKRATLLFRDVPRLKAILQHESRPVQLLLSGKAHPRDGAGKEFIREMLDVVKREGLGDSVLFLEDYDLSKASMLVQGVDVWLNTPRRPYEASGTSGMKVVPNGGLNLSVLDGWWAEAYRPGVGWAIGAGLEVGHPAYQDQLDAESLYSLLEDEVVPLFYSRDADGLPRGWIAMMKQSIRSLAPAFSGDRMVKQYTERFYLPAADHYRRLAADGFAEAKTLTSWKARVRDAWPGVTIVAVAEDGTLQRGHGRQEVAVGDEMPVAARVELAGLEPNDVIVEAFHSGLHPDGSPGTGRGIALGLVGQEDGYYLYRGAIPARTSGLHGYAVRVLPRHEDVLVPNELPLIAWEQGEEA